MATNEQEEGTLVRALIPTPVDGTETEMIVTIATAEEAIRIIGATVARGETGSDHETGLMTEEGVIIIAEIGIEIPVGICRPMDPASSKTKDIPHSSSRHIQWVEI